MLKYQMFDYGQLCPQVMMITGGPLLQDCIMNTAGRKEEDK